MRRTALLALMFCAIPLLTASAQDTSTSEKKFLTPETAVYRNVMDLHLSPDGSKLAFVISEPPKDTGRAQHIWVYDVKSGSARQLTYSKKSESNPRWSPDGKQIAFLSNRSEEQQIYLLNLAGGEGVALTKGKRGIEHFEWAPDGKQIAFLAPDAKTEAEEKKEKDKDDAHVVDKDDKRTRLWILDVARREERAITSPSWNVNEIAWMPNSEQLAAIASDNPASDRITEKIYLIPVNGGSPRQMIFPNAFIGGLRVSPRGTAISYSSSHEGGPTIHDLMLLPVSGGAPKNVSGAMLDRPIYQHKWQKSGSLSAIAATGFKNALVTYLPDGTQGHPPALLNVNATDFEVLDSGEVLLAAQNATTPPELYLWDGKSPEARPVTQLNSKWKNYTLGQPEYYKYKSFDGTEIEAALLKPLTGDAKEKFPTIVLVHGGPAGRWSDSVDVWGQLLAARGYAVFCPNIRGSIGYGEKFVESNRADWGGGDFKDVMAGVKDLVDRGIADPDRLAIGGWSYGGYMSEWAVTQTNIFKAAVSGAGMANLVSEYGTEEGPQGDEWYFGVPYEHPEAFLNSSPFLHMKDAKTPTLILQGEEDTIDPLGQSQELYRGLKRYGVETVFVTYPREPHGFHEEKHLVDRLHRILDWYDAHLKPAPSFPK